MLGEKIFTNITPKKLLQRSKNQTKEIEYIKNVLLHPRERLKHKNRLKDKPELKNIWKHYHLTPRDWWSRRLKNASVKIVYDEKFLKEFPCFNKKIRLNETDKKKRREEIFDQILKQMGPENGKYYII